MATRPNGAQAGACPQIAPLSHAIRVGLATSVVAVAFGAGASTLGAQALRGWNPPPPRVSTTIDQAPVVDLSVVSPPKAVRAFPVPAAIDQAAATDIDIDNATPIVVSQPGNVYAIRAASSDGDVLIANRAGGTLEAISPDASAFAIHARGHAVQVGNDAVVRATGAVIANAIDVQAAHGNASVRNSGELVATATGMVSRSAGPNGIRVLSGQGTASIDNSGAVGVSGGGSAVALGASGRTARVANTAALAVRGYASYGIVSGGDVAEADNRGDILADGTLAYGVGVFGAERATLANTGDIDVRATLGGTGLYAGNALSDGTVALTSDGAITVRSANATGISLRGGTVTANVDGSIAALDGTHGIGIAAGARRDVTIDSDADIDVSGTVRATAIEARSTEGPIQLRNGGSLRATSQGDAYGIDAQADAGLVEITNTGAIEAKGGREAFALYAHGDHVRVSNSGALDVAGSVGMGIFAHGDVAEVDNSGDVSIRAYSSRVAYGVRVVGFQGADVVNTGDIDVRGGDIVTGLSASDALGGARVALSTDATILARSSFGATGVRVSGDEVEATTAGSITAEGIFGVATGIGASAQQSLSLANSADVLASTGQMWSSGIDASLGGAARSTCITKAASSRTRCAAPIVLASRPGPPTAASRWSTTARSTCAPKGARRWAFSPLAAMSSSPIPARSTRMGLASKRRAPPWR